MPTPVTTLEDLLVLAATQASMNLGVRHCTSRWRRLTDAADFVDEIDAGYTPHVNSDDVDAMDVAAFAREIHWICRLLESWGLIAREHDVILIHPEAAIYRETFHTVAAVSEERRRERREGP